MSQLGQFIRNSSITILLFIMYEGFCLLPEKAVIPFPGSLRISDVFFIVFPVVAIIFCKQILFVFRQYKEESLLVLAACALMFLSPLMAKIFFNQPYGKGLLLVRHNLNYLAFFIFVPFLRDISGVERLLRMLTVLVGIYVLILITTKYFPTLGLVHFREGYYAKDGGGFSRFGESRLFFPYGDVPIFLYCLALARWLNPSSSDSFLAKSSIVLFLILVIYAVFLSYTRMLNLSLFCATIFAFFTSKRPLMRYMAVTIIILSISLAMIRMAVDTDESKLEKIASEGGNLAVEKGRIMQAEMYLNQFIRSPIAGVGTLINLRLKDSFLDKDLLFTYRKYGFFNAVDTGYPKIAAEFGLVGLSWVLWYFSYLYRRSRQTLSEASSQGGNPLTEAVARGHLYFLIYLVVSGLTLPHFVYFDGVIILALSLAILAVTRKTQVSDDAEHIAEISP